MLPTAATALLTVHRQTVCHFCCSVSVCSCSAGVPGADVASALCPCLLQWSAELDAERRRVEQANATISKLEGIVASMKDKVANQQVRQARQLEGGRAELLCTPCLQSSALCCVLLAAKLARLRHVSCKLAACTESNAMSSARS